MGQGMGARLACPGGSATWRGALNWGGRRPCPHVCLLWPQTLLVSPWVPATSYAATSSSILPSLSPCKLFTKAGSRLTFQGQAEAEGSTYNWGDF